MSEFLVTKLELGHSCEESPASFASLGSWRFPSQSLGTSENPSKSGVTFEQERMNQTAPREPGVAFGWKILGKTKNHLPNAAPLRQITQIELEPEISENGETRLFPAPGSSGLLHVLLSKPKLS